MPKVEDIDSDGLPPIRSAKYFTQNPPAKPIVLIEKLLHRGSKMVLGGGSKTNKTWMLIDLALAMATGTPFLGLNTTFCKNLYLNFEIQEGFFWERVLSIAKARGLNMAQVENNLHIWNLRGYSTDISTLGPKISERCRSEGYGAITLDPLYKIAGDREENNAKDSTDLMNRLERIAIDANAGLIFGAHFAKGNASGKEAIDRISGSGVYARDPDSIVTITKHKEDNCFTFDAILRNFSTLPSFVIEYAYPIFVRKEGLDPSELKDVVSRGGRPKGEWQDFLDALTEPLQFSSWLKNLDSDIYSKSHLQNAIKSLRKTGQIQQNHMKQWYRTHNT